MFENTAEPLSPEDIQQEVCRFWGMNLSRETCLLIWKRWQLNIAQPHDSREAAQTPNVVSMIGRER
jgi:hypothetical protein